MPPGRGGGGNQYGAHPSFSYQPYGGNPYPGAPAPPPNVDSTGRRDAAAEGRKLFIGGIPTTGIDSEVIRYDFERFGEIEDAFVPADRNEPGKIRGIAFVTYKERESAQRAIQEMHNRNYHGREITCNAAKPRGPDPKKDGTFHTDERYGGKYDAGGRLRPEFRDHGDPRFDRGANDQERVRDYNRTNYSHGQSCALLQQPASPRVFFAMRFCALSCRTCARSTRVWPRRCVIQHVSERAARACVCFSDDGSGRYGERDPRPVQDYYD